MEDAVLKGELIKDSELKMQGIEILFVNYNFNFTISQNRNGILFLLKRLVSDLNYGEMSRSIEFSNCDCGHSSFSSDI